MGNHLLKGSTDGNRIRLEQYSERGGNQGKGCSRTRSESQLRKVGFRRRGGLHYSRQGKTTCEQIGISFPKGKRKNTG